MTARTKTKVTPKYKTKYRVKNWAVYDQALRERGDITVALVHGSELKTDPPSPAVGITALCSCRAFQTAPFG